jgi:hypothetical protein
VDKCFSHLKFSLPELKGSDILSVSLPGPDRLKRTTALLKLQTGDLLPGEVDSEVQGHAAGRQTLGEVDNPDLNTAILE